MDISSWSPVYKWKLILVIIVPANVLAPHHCHGCITYFMDFYPPARSFHVISVSFHIFNIQQVRQNAQPTETNWHAEAHSLNNVYVYSLAKFIINLLVPEWCGSDLKSVISEHMFQSSWAILVNTVIRQMPQNTFDGRSTLFLVMAWCRRQLAITWVNANLGPCCHIATMSQLLLHRLDHTGHCYNC